MKRLSYKIHLNAQPTETTCGPTCLHGIYNYLNLSKPHDKLISEIRYTEGGGTLAVNLGIHALQSGFDVKIYTHNLNIFDPSWFGLDKHKMIDKLAAQSQAKTSVKTIESSRHYVEFLALGGRVMFEDLTPSFLSMILDQEGPVICGLSSTYLYMCQRELNDANCTYDDVRGYPQGHFVVLKGISEDLHEVEIADPLPHNPLQKGQDYIVSTRHFINSILVGVITYDANILVISPKKAGFLINE